MKQSKKTEKNARSEKVNTKKPPARKRPVDPVTGKGPGGRPSKYSVELTDTICSLIAAGQSLSSICRAPEMPDMVTVYSWMRIYPEFLSSYTRAREEQAETMADQILSIADDEDDPNNKRIRIDARKWVAAKLKPTKYGDRQQVDHEHSGSVQLIQLDQLSAHKLDE